LNYRLTSGQVSVPAQRVADLAQRREPLAESQLRTLIDHEHAHAHAQRAPVLQLLQARLDELRRVPSPPAATHRTHRK
jgi:hypothetical protein